jgi:hypothetical protein
MDDVQVVVAEPKPRKGKVLYKITDPVCRNLQFGDGPRGGWIILRQAIPADYPDDTPDVLLNKIPGEAIVDPSLKGVDPVTEKEWSVQATLDVFRKQHGNHARIEELRENVPA